MYHGCQRWQTTQKRPLPKLLLVTSFKIAMSAAARIERNSTGAEGARTGTASVLLQHSHRQPWTDAIHLHGCKQSQVASCRNLQRLQCKDCCDLKAKMNESSMNSIESRQVVLSVWFEYPLDHHNGTLHITLMLLHAIAEVAPLLSPYNETAAKTPMYCTSQSDCQQPCTMQLPTRSC